MNEFNNSVNINSFGLVFGSVVINYERLFSSDDGLLIQGGYSTEHGLIKGTWTELKMQYRYYYLNNNTHKDLSSPFWGPFLFYRTGKIDKNLTYEGLNDIDFQQLKAGVSWGKRWDLNIHINIVFTIGYGIPLYCVQDKWFTLTHSNGFPNELAIIAGIDSELSIGYAF